MFNKYTGIYTLSISSKMRLVPQEQKIEVILNNYDEETNRSKKHGTLLPSSIRAAICGPSGCGKTCVMMSLLYNQNGLRFENIYLFCKTLFQPKYQQLEGNINSIEGMSYVGSNETVTPLCEVKPNSILIFDDVSCESQKEIRNAYCMGRHKGVDCFYLTQTYTSVPKHLLRDNLNFIVLFKQDLLNMKHVYEDHVAGDLSFTQFQKLCSLAWRNPHDFLVIAKDFNFNDGRYRQGFDNFFQDISTG